MSNQENNDQYEEYRASSGITIWLRPVSPMFLNKVVMTVEEPEPPTYQMESLPGLDPITFTYDEKAIQDEDVSALDKARWQKYLQDVEDVAEKRRTKGMEAVFARGVKVDMPEDNGWVEEQEFYGVTVPTNPVDRRVHYIMTEVLMTQQEMVEVMAKITGKTAGVSEEAIEAVNKSFRGTLQGATDSELAPSAAETEIE